MVRQGRRYYGTSYRSNALLDEKGIKKYCALDDECREIMMDAYDKMALSMRGYHKILKIARTIADLDGKEQIHATHLFEALRFRTISMEELRK